jgi:hypothetical protein
VLDPEDVRNTPLEKFAFYQLKQCHITQGLNQDIQNFPFGSFSSLTTKHRIRYELTVENIIDFLIVFKTVAT